MMALRISRLSGLSARRYACIKYASSKSNINRFLINSSAVVAKELYYPIDLRRKYFSSEAKPENNNAGKQADANESK
jgi:hypothetical protein